MNTYKCRICSKEIQDTHYRCLCDECQKLKKIDKLNNEAKANLRNRYVEISKTHRKKLKKLALEYKGDKCQICGYSASTRALQFHHVDPSTKKFGIGDKGYTRSWQAVKEELDKCILVCSNCHAEIHDGLIDLSNISLEPANPNVFDSLIDKIKKVYTGDYKKSTIVAYKKSNIDTTLENFCKAQAQNRKVKRPDTYEEFMAEFTELNFNYCAMGRKYGVSDNAIRKWEKSYKKYGF